jgi:ABC-type cobalt transport system substrate-binding protein
MKSKIMKVLTVAMIMAFGLVFNLSTSLEDWEATDGAAFAQSEERDSEGAFTK